MQMGVLPERFKQQVTVCEKIPDDDLYRYGKGTSVRAIIQPMTQRTAIEKYGERIDRMRAMYYEGNAAITEGMGVCVDVGSDVPCDYRVVAVDTWPGHHQEIALEWIAPEGRGSRGEP